MIKFLFLIYSSIIGCPLVELKRKSILRGNYKDIIQYQQKSLILPDTVIYYGGQFNSQLNRDAIYDITTITGYTFCAQYHSIIFQLSNSFEINTVIVELWDRWSNAAYDLQIFVIDHGQETKIYENTAISGFVKISFQDQLVDKIKIYNRGGSVYNQYLSVIKAQAFYSINI